MMSKLKYLTGAAAGLLMSMGAAHAGTINFADYASGNEHGVSYGTVIDFDGVQIAFKGYGYDGSYTALYAYFDDVSGGLPAGLGVCRELDINDQCVDASDDSTDGDLGLDEGIRLDFVNTAFDLRSISFRDGQHNLINDKTDGHILWSVTNSSNAVTSGTSSFADFVTLVTSGAFLDTIKLSIRFVDTEFYIEEISDVPIPGALPLLLSGLAGLGFASRRRKQQA